MFGKYGSFYLLCHNEGWLTGLGLAVILLEMGWQGIDEEIHFGGGFYGVGKQLSVFVVGGGGYIGNLDVIFCNLVLNMSKVGRYQFPQF